MKTVRLVAGLVLLFPVLAFAETSVSDVKVAQRWPWNGLVDIELSVRQDEGKDVRLFVFCGSHQEERRRHNRRQDRVGDDGAALVSVKGSAQLVSDPESADGFRLLVYVPPAKNLAAGLCRLYDVELIDAAGDNVVTDVKLTAQ